MRVPLTNADYEKSREEIDRVLYLTRTSLTNLRLVWKKQIVGKEVVEEAMKERIDRSLQARLDVLNSILTIKNSRVTDWENIKAYIGTVGGKPSTEIEDTTVTYITLIQDLMAMPKDTYRDQTAICDFIEAEVATPLTYLLDT